MRITRGMPSGEGERSLAGTFTLLPVGSGAQRKYSRTFSLSLRTGGAGDGIVFLGDSRLRLGFPLYEFDAKASGAVDAASAGNSGSDAVLLSLPTARTIYRVKVSGAHTSDTIKAFRTDGNVTADDPVAQASHGDGGAVLNVVDQRLLLRRRDGTTGTDTPLRAN